LWAVPYTDEQIETGRVGIQGQADPDAGLCAMLRRAYPVLLRTLTVRPIDRDWTRHSAYLQVLGAIRFLDLYPARQR